MRFILIHSFEREIFLPEIFDNYDEALWTLLEQMSDALHESPEDLYERYYFRAANDIGIYDDWAYAKVGNIHMDWKIFTINEDWEVGCI